MKVRKLIELCKPMVRRLEVIGETLFSFHLHWRGVLSVFEIGPLAEGTFILVDAYELRKVDAQVQIRGRFASVHGGKVVYQTVLEK